MIATVKLLATHAAPAGRPAPLTFHDGKLWVGCWDTARLYAIDPATWATIAEIELPGKPYGLASHDGALRIVVSIGADDDRYLYRLVPGRPLDERDRVPCDQHTGSHLTAHAGALYLVQQSFRRMIELNGDGSVKRAFPFATRTAGVAFAGDTFYTIAADDEFDVLQLATLDLEAERAEPAVIAPMDAEARGLAFDGATWWTSYRERNEIVAFSF